MLNTKYNVIIYSALLSFGFSVFVNGYIGYKFNPEPIKTTADLVTKAEMSKELFDKEMVLSKNIFDLEVVSGKRAGADTLAGNNTKNNSVSANSSNRPSAGSGATKTEEEFEGKLLGVLVGDDVFLAIIKFKGDVVILRKGIPNDELELMDVFPDSVNVKYDGDIYSLTFPEENIAGVSGAQNQSGEKNNANKDNLHYQISKQYLTTKLQDMNSILRTVFISPHYNNGNFVGYRVSRLADSSPLKQVGIRQGDILVQINGETLDSPNKMLELFSKIDDLTAAKIDILRNGERKTLFVEVKS
jgi:general secretion pathway protein C